MAPVAVTAFTATTALGPGLQAQRQALEGRRSGLRRNDLPEKPLECWIGRVEGVEAVEFPAGFEAWRSRNHRLAWLGLQQDGFLDAARAAVAHHGAARVAVVIGTSTSSIGETEDAYTRLEDGRFPADLARLKVHSPDAASGFVRAATGAAGPALTVATACSSSAKVFAHAARLMQAGLADAAIVGGVDTLCGSVLYGFNALQLVSAQPCRPFDAARDGLSLGEAAGFALLERQPGAGQVRAWLAGYGESSDAHHMSSPHPEGLGARRAMEDALARAGLAPGDIGYLSLHGTATPANDSVEAAAVAALFPDTLHASSTKGWTGHTLGAAGIVETAFSLLALEHGLLPGTLNSTAPDPACGPQIRFDNARADIVHAMNNAFGFGGNNCSLVFSRA
ncbi:beta-ketoacyl-[acyl-carrier-protein] synthase family protein [Pseudoxanthomonas suwonensis]|uniref:beta-ketoacyl-[acyl-carrier-protein] synthase family protein n=1 Tax=Pseudoxanthomonas suwonensis TaxID=314722 RepID=UPI00138F61B3|nr:beta-ketoacyl-[acyl-carrier-protein] synthase family protein [Pseudoxanthomonas suwonensis]KAF1702827.1 beta-ketoacyl-[acyl-carrier-protein] synthase II [Pseudoxanthomonas suwonensis]